MSSLGYLAVELQKHSILLFAVLFCIANVKALFLAWHVRIFKIFPEIFHSRNKFRPGSKDFRTEQDLFQEVSYRTRAPLLECDYNLHKSNSTYFTDLDSSRIQLIAKLFSNIIVTPGGGSLNPVLGGTSCVFKQEIKPYTPYYVTSRILCWDEKWVYVISHFKRNDQRQKKRPTDSKESTTSGHEAMDVYASALTKYVFKNGRMTVPPKTAFEQAGFRLPQEGDSKASRQRSTTIGAAFNTLSELHSV